MSCYHDPWRLMMKQMSATEELRLVRGDVRELARRLSAIRTRLNDGTTLTYDQRRELASKVETIIRGMECV